jgi:hypothetical protein
MYGWYLSYGQNEAKGGAFFLAESLVAGKSIDTNAVTFSKTPPGEAPYHVQTGF